MLAQAVDLGLGRGDERGARVRVDALAAAGGRAHRQHAREHEHLVGARPGEHALRQPERVAQHQRRRREHAPAAAAESHLHAYARA